MLPLTFIPSTAQKVLNINLGLALAPKLPFWRLEEEDGEAKALPNALGQLPLSPFKHTYLHGWRKFDMLL